MRHATFISKNYDDSGVEVYVFSDKTSCKLFLSVSEQFMKDNPEIFTKQEELRAYPQ